MAIESVQSGALGGTTETATAVSSFANTQGLSGYYKEASARILDLSSSDAEVMTYVAKQLESTADSPGKRAIIQQLFETRSRIEQAFTNILKTLAETARGVINNIRP